jgi:creatinine amidohydrolase
MNKWRFDSMFPADLEEAVKRFPVVWLSLSPLEWHGEALAFGCDPALGYELSRQAWERLGGVLLPPLYVGTGNNFAETGGEGLAGRWENEKVVNEPKLGSIFVRPTTLEMVLRDYLHFLEHWGFRLCVVTSGHGAEAHMARIVTVCEEQNAAFGRGESAMLAHCWMGDPAGIPEELLFEGAGSHADFSEASALGSIDPNMVKAERFGVHPRDRETGLLSENAGRIDFGKGRRVLALLAGQLAGTVGKILGDLGIGEPI